MQIKGRCIVLFDEFLHNLQGFFYGLVKVVVDDNAVELGCLRQLECGTLDALLDYFGSVGGASGESTAQFFDRWRLYENAQRAVAIILLDVATALYVNVENYVLATCSLRFHLLLQRSVEAVLINLLIFKELIAGYTLTKFFGSYEEILYTVLLCSAWLA